MYLNLIIANILIQFCYAAGMASKIIIGRFDGYGKAQILMDCDNASCVIPSVELQPIEGIFKCEKIEYKDDMIVPPCHVCRVSYGMDGGFEETAQVEGVTLTWKDTHKNAVLIDFITAYVTEQLEHCNDTDRKALLKKYDATMLAKQHNLFFDSNVFVGSRYGTQSGIATLRGTSTYYSAPTKIGNFLRTSSAKGIMTLDKIAFVDTETFCRAQPPTCLSTYEILKLDTFKAAVHVLEQRPTDQVMIINFANNLQPGGGYLKGARAQEEDLFRCSNLSWILGGQINSGLYPINTVQTANAVFNSHVHIMRDRSNFNAFYTEEQIAKYIVSVCSLGAFNFNNDIDSVAAFDPAFATAESKSKFFNAHGLEVTMNRIRVMFQTAILKGVDTIILGAFGCGAFGNDPVVITRLFSEVMAEYHNRIPHVVFAIIGPTENVGAFEALQFPQ